MLSEKQCELARLLTQDTASDIQINSEYAVLLDETKTVAAQAIDELVKLHNMPFDKAVSVLAEDFKTISSQHGISPATLFCVYMEIKNKGIL